MAIQFIKTVHSKTNEFKSVQIYYDDDKEVYTCIPAFKAQFENDSNLWTKETSLKNASNSAKKMLE